MWIWRDKVYLRPDFFLLLLALPSQGARFLLFVLACAAHELGHLLCLRVFSAPVKLIRLTAFGAEIHAPLLCLSYQQELLTALAGPASNLLLAFLAAGCREGYLFAGMNLLLALMNLLPISGLDGGRVLEILLCWCWDPVRGAALSRVLGKILPLLFLGAALCLCWRSGGNFFLLLAALGLFFV